MFEHGEEPAPGQTTDADDAALAAADECWGDSPEEFESWVADKLRVAPSYAEYPEVIE